MSRHLSILRIFALNAMAGCIDLVYAVVSAYFVPAIYNLGLSPVYGPMLLSISPLMGIIFQSYLGSASDYCQCWWGRRRPFIIGLTISCLIGLLLFPFTENLTDAISELKIHKASLIILVIISTFLADFSAGSLQVPVRAYLLDVLPQHRLKVGNTIHTTCATGGAAIGFVIGAVKWSSIFISSDNFSFQVKFVCIATFFIVTLCAISTLCSVKEQNPQVVSNDSKDLELIRFYDYQLQQCRGTQTQLNSMAANVLECISMDEIIISTGNSDFVKHKSKTCQYWCFTKLLITLQGNFNFLKSMSSSMIVLCVSVFFIYVGMSTEVNFFTSYVAEVVYDGDVNAPENSTAYQDYTDGVTFGSLALGISAVVALVVSFVLGPIIKLVGMRCVFVSSCVLLMLQSGVFIITSNKIVTLVLAPAVYVTLIVVLSIPFILVSLYENKGLLLRKSKSHIQSNENLIGRACAVLVIVFLSGQACTRIVNGPLITAYGSMVSVMIVTCGTSFIGAIVACFMTVPYKTVKELRDSQKTDASTQTD